MTERTPPEAGSAGQPKGKVVDRDFVRGRLKELGLGRAEMLRLGRGRIASRTLQRLLNSPGTRLSTSSGEALAGILGCGCLDVFPPSSCLATRVARFALHPPILQAPILQHWLVRPEEHALEEALRLKRPVVVVGPPRSGKTSLLAKLVSGALAQFPFGVLWISASLPAAEARSSVSECLRLFPPEGAHHLACNDDHFAQALWSRPRLVVVDDLTDRDWVQGFVGPNRRQMSLVAVTDRTSTALAVERELGARAVSLQPFPDPQVVAFLESVLRSDARVEPLGPVGFEPPTLKRALRGEPSALRTLSAHADALRRAARGWGGLLDAVAGNPGAMHLAADLVKSTRFRSLGEIAEILGASQRAKAVTSWERDAPTSRVLSSLAILGGAAPMEWVTAVADVGEREVRTACEELGGAIDGRTLAGAGVTLTLAPHARPLASRALDGQERERARGELVRVTLAAARALGSLPPDVAFGAFLSQEEVLLVGLRHMAARASPTATREALVDALVALSRVLPASRRDELQELLEAGAAAASERDRPLDAFRLRRALGRWLIASRADFVAAETHLGASAADFARMGLHGEAADTYLDAGVACLASLRTSAGVSALREGAAEARRASLAPTFLARHLANQAFGESRSRDGHDGLEGWRRSRALLDEALGLEAEAPGGDDVLWSTIRCNRAITGAVLGTQGWKVELGVALRAALRTPAGPFSECYHLSTAEAAGVLLCRSRDEQRQRIRATWRRMLRCRGAEIPECIQRLGEMAFYLNNLETGDGLAWHANSGVLATDGTPLSARGVRGTLPLTFFARPMLQVFDARFLEAVKRLFWQQGGPRLQRALAEVEALQRRVHPPSERPPH